MSALDELAAKLVIPAKAGVYLTKNELISLARAAEGSLRINERRRMLADVLKSAQSGPELRGLLSLLIERCRAERAKYDELVAAYPVMRAHAAEWTARIAKTITFLEETSEEIAFAEDQPPLPDER